MLGVETVNFSPLPLFYPLLNVHNFLEKIFQSLYNMIGRKEEENVSVVE
jgi:hypothetical protein